MNKKIYIIGGGFGGISAARTLAAKKLKNTDIVLISNKTYFEYYPALYRLVTGASPIEACVPLSSMLPKCVEVVHDTVVSVDGVGKHIVGESGAEYSYDALVLSMGSQTTYFGLPGLDELSFGFKSVSEALRLKNHITSLFEAHAHPTKEEMVSHFHIVIVGGGASGVEVAGDLSAHMHHLAKKFAVDPSFITIDLIESNGRLLPALSEKVSARILARIRTLGINVFLNRTLMKEEIDSVYMKDMSLQSKTVIWTAGTALNSLFQTIPGLTFSPRKRVEVNEFLESKIPGVYVIGDAAATPFSGLAQTAISDGKQVGEIIAATLTGKNPRKYTSKEPAYSIPVGDNWGVFVMGPVAIYGIIAYFMRHLIDFIYFAGIVDVNTLLGMYFEGKKYRE